MKNILVMVEPGEDVYEILTLMGMLPQSLAQVKSMSMPAISPHFVASYIDDELAGVFFHKVKRNTLVAMGTYVVYKHRRKWVAFSMWRDAIAKANVTKVRVSTVTRMGTKFVAAVKGKLNVVIDHSVDSR